MNLEWTLFGLRLTATAILYVFLGVAFYLIWRDLKQQEQADISPPPLTDQLRVIAAPEGQSLVAGQTFPLPEAILLGIGPENTVVLCNADAPIKQVRLCKKDDEWWLEDPDHESGARLNNLPLAEPAPLTHGDVIDIAGVQFRLETVTG
ncbi:MAG: hypothetical protein JXM69_12640 [Anaerolineae bacterium]|nr:hypothetical protein [Anaerolineae bacterium]